MYSLACIISRLFGGLCLYWSEGPITQLVDNLVDQTGTPDSLRLSMLCSELATLLLTLSLALILIIKPEVIISRISELKNEPDSPPFDLFLFARIGFVFLGIYIFTYAASDLCSTWIDSWRYKTVFANEATQKAAAAVVYAVVAFYGAMLVLYSKGLSRWAVKTPVSCNVVRE